MYCRYWHFYGIIHGQFPTWLTQWLKRYPCAKFTSGYISIEWFLFGYNAYLK